MKIIDKIAWIEIQNGKILSTKSFDKDKYYLPGGKRELGESDQQTLIREISEELNVSIQPDTIKYIGTFEAQADSHPEGTIVKMTCYSAEYSGHISANSEIETVEWLNYDDMGKVSEVDKIIFSFLKNQELLQ